MEKIITKEEVKIENMIYEIRGKQVMLDRDLARLYQCSNGTKTINQAVSRNINRFPDRYMFQLSEEEFLNLKSQIGTAYNMSRSLPHAFTEQGVAMLATILRTSVAEKISIQIMDAFVEMRKYISTNLIEQQYINNLVFKHDNDIKLLQESFDKLNFKEKNTHIFYEGQIYDAYSKIIDIFNMAKNETIIIDNFLDKAMLDIISKCNNNVILITADKLVNIDLLKYNKQYKNLQVIINKSFHDRFIILDRNILYHLGSSLNSIGKKCFAITKIDDFDILNQLIRKLKLQNFK